MSKYNWVRHARHVRGVLAEGVGAAFMFLLGNFVQTTRQERKDVLE